MATALQQAHTPMSTVYSDIENQITRPAEQGPAEQVRDGRTCRTSRQWADHLADSSAHLNFEQKSVADTMESRFIPQLVAAGVKSSTARTDVDHLTNSILNTGKTSDATKAARAKLIADLEKSGMNATTAKGKVDKYITSLGNIPKKDLTQILLSGKGEWSIKESNIYPTPSGKAPNPILHPGAAAGMLVSGGTPGKDSVLLSAMPGELVVPVPLVNSGAVDHLRGKIPGFGTGGYVGQGTSGLAKFGQQHYTAEWSSMVRTMEEDMARGAAAAARAAVQRRQRRQAAPVRQRRDSRGADEVDGRLGRLDRGAVAGPLQRGDARGRVQPQRDGTRPAAPTAWRSSSTGHPSTPSTAVTQRRPGARSPGC